MTERLRSSEPADGLTPDQIDRYRGFLRGETDGAYLYRAIAAAEPDERLREVYRRLAESEVRHGAFWRERLRAAGDAYVPRVSWRARVLALLARRFGPGFVVSTVAGREKADRAMYDREAGAPAAGLPRDERLHARILRELSGGGGLAGPALARLEGRHRTVGGNVLRAAVLGVNDGLVSNLSIVMGVAGAGADRSAILIAGVAGLLAGGFSMALGEWISVQSARELFTAQVGVEESELTAFPEEEEEELALIYQAKGMAEGEARALAGRIMRGERGIALDTLAREELGIDPDELGGSAWAAALTSFATFAVGAVVPLVGFATLSGVAGIAASLATSAVALFLVGAAITIVTGHDALRAGTRQVAIGLAAAAVTYLVGSALGVVLG